MDDNVRKTLGSSYVLFMYGFLHADKSAKEETQIGNLYNSTIGCTNYNEYAEETTR